MCLIFVFVSEYKTSIDLLKVGLKTMLLTKCDINKTSEEFQNGIDESQYCAYDFHGRMGSCPTIGGPLLTTQTHENPIKVVGIASSGTKCTNGYPVIYTRVAYFIEWIGSHVWPNGEIDRPNVSIAENENNSSERYIFPET